MIQDLRFKNENPKKISQSQGIKLPEEKVESTAQPEPEIKRTNIKDRRFKLLRVAVIAFIIFTALAYGGYKLVAKLTTSPQASKQDIQVDKILEELGKVVELPGDEEPTVLTVTNLEPLKDQIFFSEAKIGDKVFIFSKAKKALLYRPSEKRLIAIAPIK